MVRDTLVRDHRRRNLHIFFSHKERIPWNDLGGEEGGRGKRSAQSHTWTMSDLLMAVVAAVYQVRVRHLQQVVQAVLMAARMSDAVPSRRIIVQRRRLIV